MRKAVTVIVLISLALCVVQSATALTINASQFAGINGIQLGMSFEQVRQRTEGIAYRRIWQSPSQ